MTIQARTRRLTGCPYPPLRNQGRTRQRARRCAASDSAWIAALVEELAGKSVLRGEDFHTIQLLIDEGEPARNAVLAKLQAMDLLATRPHSIAYGALFHVPGGIGDESTEPVLRTYLSHPDKRIVHYAKIEHRAVEKGMPVSYYPGY